MAEVKKENVDKLVQLIADSAVVAEDVEKALEDGKINVLTEGAPLVIKHSGKLLSLITGGKEILEEIIDLDPAEAEEVFEAVAAAYALEDTEKREGAKHILKGLAELRTGLLMIISKK